MGFSTYGANATSNAFCNNTSLAVAQMYIKLHTATPTLEGTSAAATETTRKAASYGASSAGVCTSDADITWSAVAGNETISHISCWDAVGPAGGNCVATGVLSSPRTVAIGDTLQILTGALTWTSTPVAAA